MRLLPGKASELWETWQGTQGNRAWPTVRGFHPGPVLGLWERRAGPQSGYQEGLPLVWSLPRSWEPPGHQSPGGNLPQALGEVGRREPPWERPCPRVDLELCIGVDVWVLGSRGPCADGPSASEPVPPTLVSSVVRREILHSPSQPWNSGLQT